MIAVQKVRFPGILSILSFTFLIVILVGNAFFLNYNAFRCFNMLDMGGFLDASWRVFCGQRPYIDFIYYSGPMHLYMNAFFFFIFGFGKTAILAHLILVHSVVVVLIFLMLYKQVPRLVTFLVTLLTTPSFYWNVSHPWHDQSTHFWGIIGIFLIVQQFYSKSKRLFRTSIICGILSMVAFITKTNLGVAYVVLFFLVFISFSERKKALGGYFLGIAIGIILSLFIIRFPGEYLNQSIFDNSVLLKSRLGILLNPAGWFVNYYWVMVVIVISNVVMQFEKTRKCQEMVYLFILVSLMGIYAANTGGVLTEANNFLWGIQMALAVIVLYALRNPELSVFKKRFQQVSFVLSKTFIGFLIFLAVRDGVQLKVWTYVKWRPLGNYRIKSKPMEGWLAYKLQGESLDRMVEYINMNIPKNESLLNLTDMYIVYALTNRDSYRGITCTFIDGIIPNPGRQTQQVHRNILSNLPKWIVLSFDSINVEIKYLGIKDVILSSYKPVVRTGIYTLWRKI